MLPQTRFFDFLPDPSKIVGYMALSGFIMAGTKYLYNWIKRTGTKRAIAIISSIGLLATGLIMTIISLFGGASMFQYTGIIVPFVQPLLMPIQHMTPQEGSIFGLFTSFFTSTTILGSASMTVGFHGIKKIMKVKRKDNDPTCYG